jgi:addiction module HigA family antidote
MADFAPTHPGEILLTEFLEPMGISQYRIAKAIDVPPRRINEIVHGKRGITADTGLRLSRALGLSDMFFVNMQAHYDAEIAREKYTYDVIVRRHFDFPNSDAIGYGYGICDKVIRGEPYGAVMADVKNDVMPNDEQAANYVVSNAVGILCPAQIWQLRNSAAGYRPPPA